MLHATKSVPRAALLCLVISIVLSAPCAVRGAPQGPAATSIATALSSAESPSQSFNVSLLVLNATGLLAKLPSLAPLTLFAPTDAAWRAAFHALALPYLSGYIPFPGAAVGGETPGSPGSPENSSGSAGSSDAANPGGIAQPAPAPGVAPAAGGASGGASAAMIPGLPQVDLPLPGVPSVAIPGIPGGSDRLNSTIPVDNMTIPMPDLNMTMPDLNMTMPDFNSTFPNINMSMNNPLTFDPLLAALSAVFSGDGTPASLAALAKERPKALKALSELLAYHVATTALNAAAIAALNAAAIAAQFTVDAGNLTTVNGQGLWINFNKSESAALLNAYSPAQRALISQGISVGYDGTVYYPNGTTVAANGTVIFDPATSPIAVDSEGNTFFANGTVVGANGTVVSTNGTLATNGTAIAIDGPGLPLPPTVSSPPSNGDGSVAPRGVAGAQMMMEPAPLMGGGPADMPPATNMPAPADVPPVTATPAPADMPPNILVDPIPGVMGGWGMGGDWGNWSTEVQQQWWRNATEWMNKVVPWFNVTASEYLAWLNSSFYAWAAGSDAMWEQAGSDMKVARVVRADLMDSAGMVVHGVDGVLFPHYRDMPVFDKGGGGGGEGDVPMPIAMPVVAPGGVANGSTNGAGTNGTATGGQSDDSAAGGAGAPAAAGSSSSSNSSSGGQDASKSAASGTPAPPTGSPAAGKSQSKAAAGERCLLHCRLPFPPPHFLPLTLPFPLYVFPLLLTAALSLVALL
ncbi:unnamed protein product [Closterium sp. Naga37s-1]|nr:unnamed protein product [Closterium sp. Naga37s-1]